MYWALESECKILMFMWPLGPLGTRHIVYRFLQGLLSWLFQKGLKVSLGSVGGIEAVMALALVFLK